MNWFLSEGDIRDMQDTIAGRRTPPRGQYDNVRAMAQLISWWNGRPLATDTLQAPPPPYLQAAPAR